MTIPTVPALSRAAIVTLATTTLLTPALAAQEPPTWPGAEWPVSNPEAEGVDPAAIAALVADIDAGRYGLIVPEHDLVSVFNGWTLHQRAEMSSWAAMRDRIIPAVRDR